MIDNPNTVASTRPYLLRALYEWCTDNGFTPYLAVYVDETVRVPMEYVKNNEIVLNIGFDATSGLVIGNEFVEFKARFAGVAREIHVPVDRVVAIYARENGQGMAFPVPQAVPPRGMADDSSAGSAPTSVPTVLSAVPASAAPSGDAKGSSVASAPKPRSAKPGLRLAPDAAAESGANSAADAAPSDEPPPPSPATPKGGGKKPALKRVK